jgi:tetratricopeptide (TPR) repeat protein
MSADGSFVEEYEITRHGKLALVTPGAKALTDFRAVIAALKALRHPKPEFSCSWFSGDVKALRWSSASAVAGRVVTTLVLASLLPTGPAFCQTTGKTVRHHKVTEDTPELIQAEAAIEKKGYATAEALLNKAVAADPTNYQAWFDLGFVYNALGNANASIAAYRKSVAAKPDVFESNLNLGLTLAKTGQPDAEQFLRAATKLNPTSHIDEGRARAWLSLAHVLEAGKPDEAVEAYRQAGALQPKNPEAHLSAGPVLEKLNRFADAEQEYKQALTIEPESTDALTGLANIYMRGHRFTEAEDILRKLVALHPSDAGAHLQLGRMLATDGQNDNAITELQSALKFAPGDAAAQRDLADVYAAGGKYELAEAQYRSLLAAGPNDAELHHDLGQALLKQHKFPEAQQELLAAVKLKPGLGAAYGDLAIAADENKNYELTIKALDARAKLLPEMPVTYFLRATAYDHLHLNKPAAENYHRFLEVANGKFPDQEWQARHRLITIEPKK